MRIDEWLSHAQKQLMAAGITVTPQDAISEARYLLCRFLQCPQSYIFAHIDAIIDAAQLQRLNEWLAQRCDAMPLAYLCGRVEFYGQEFIVSKDVLIPRPDSETLLELAQSHFPDKNAELNILELAAGSGALGLSMLKIYQNAHLLMGDISSVACDVMHQNTKLMGLEARARIIQSDWLADIAPDNKVQKFNCIIINPPYIRRNDIASLSPSVRDYEPHLALDGGADGLDCYRILNAELPPFCDEQTMLLMEIGAGQQPDVIAAMQNFTFVQGKQDLAGVMRALSFTMSL
ncbi:MAG: peptide chain release factor N(5)-glutamine methyltransferase [Alphaproteobacteria bacterium]|nr:peptide chain release factor N(5)-glutamine methyltransferase [Alphaproteobacteria bacterium]